MQDEGVEHGMPGAVAKAGLEDRILPLDQIVPDLVRRVRRARAPVRTTGDAGLASGLPTATGSVTGGLFMAVARAEATWSGTLKEGAGTMKGASGYLDAPFTFRSRFEGDAGGTNPEELIGAAHAGCFSMFLASLLTKDGFPPDSIRTSATVHLEAGPAIAKIELVTEAKVPKIDEKSFQERVDAAKKGCPVSKALASVPSVTVSARLVA